MNKIDNRIRLLSGLALVMLAGVCAVGVVLIISNPGLTLLYVICALALFFGGWLILSARGQRLWWGMGLSAVAAIAALAATWRFVSGPKNLGWLLILAALAVAYSALVTLIARQYWQARRQAATPPPRRGPSALIINPKSGGGRATKAHIAGIARDQGVKVIVMRTGQDLVVLAENAIASGAKVLGVSGGDGSLGVLAAVAIKHDLPLVVLPGGTRCHFARDIGLDPERIADALAGFQGVERRVDVGIIGDRVFLNNASFGLYADVISHDDYRDHKLEVTMRVARDLASSEQPYYPLEFKAGRATWHHAAEMFVGVNRYETLNLLELGERKQLDQGILQMVAIRSLDDGTLKQLGSSLRLASPAGTGLHQWTARSFKISHPAGWLNAGVDGESLRLKSPVQLSVRHRALRLLVPAEGARARPIPRLSGTAARTLWSLVTAKNR